MKKIISIIFLLLLSVMPLQAQQPKIYLPIILKGTMPTLVDPILRLRSSNGIIVDILGPDSGWRLANPNWNPQIARIKGGGARVNSALASGQRLTNHEYDNVIETIPLSLRGIDQDKAMQTAHEMLQLLDQASNYWDRSFEYDPVWLEAKLPCNDCFTAYSRVVIGNIPELTNPFGQPFFSDINPEPVMEDITLVIEREPFWRPTEPGTIIGPLYNLIDNPDFELWNFGIADSQPDSWENLESLWITGTNNRQSTAVKFGRNALRINVSGSTLVGASKGITQVIEDTEDVTEYTILAWVRSDGISNGVGRILITYASQFELYRLATSHGWTLYTGKITTGIGDVVAISVEILTTAANTDGTFYIDGLMFIEGDWEQEAIDNVLPWMSGSHIVNHWDQSEGAVIKAGDINWVDAWNIPGSVDSLIRLEFTNNATPADFAAPVEIYSKIRIGQRRSNDILNFKNYHDPVGVSDTEGSSDDRLDSGNLSSEWRDITTHLISNNVIDNEGRFRVFARIYDTISSGDPTLQLRLNYFIGDSSVGLKILDSITAGIRAQWTIVDLTRLSALQWDQKFSSDVPAQLGYTIQMKRDIDTDEGRFDYSIIMPTDGGFIDIDLNIPLTFGNSAVVDNVNLSQSVKATTVKSNAWIREFTPTIGPHIFEEFKGNLYAGGGLLTDGTIFRRKGGTWSEVFSSPAPEISGIDSLEVFNGVLYAGSSDTAFNDGIRILSTEDGEAWTDIHNGPANFSYSDLKAFNGLLWAASYTVGGADSAFVETFDGTVWVTQRAINGGIFSRTGKMEVYNNRLYLIIVDITGATESVEQFDINSGWSVSLGPDGTRTFYDLTVFKGRLFLTTGSDGEIFMFDGDTWSSVVVSSGEELISAYAFNDKLYAIDGNGTMFVSDDGTTWGLASAQAEAAAGVRGDLFEFQGILFLCNASSVFAFSPQGISYQVSNYNGIPFFAPSRKQSDFKRHRYFFSYDRENFINNIDDKALVGIGFVPQYLTIRGKN